jgi:hypothetical protein
VKYSYKLKKLLLFGSPFYTNHLVIHKSTSINAIDLGIFCMLVFKIGVPFSNFCPYLGHLHFHLPLCLWDPSRLGTKSFFSKFNFNAYLALHKVSSHLLQLQVQPTSVYKMSFHFLGCLPLLRWVKTSNIINNRSN